MDANFKSYLVPLLGLISAYFAVVMSSWGNNLLYDAGRSFLRSFSRGTTLRLTKTVEGVMGLWFWGLGITAFALVLFVTTNFRTPMILPISLIVVGIVVGTAAFAYLLGHKIKSNLIILLCAIVVLISLMGLALTQTA